MSNTRLIIAEKHILNYSLIAAGVGVIPIPIVDVALLASVDLKLVHQLAKTYEVEFSHQLATAIIAALIGSSVPLSFSSNLVRMIPIYGNTIGAISRAVLGGSSTYAIGKVFIQHFEAGGTLLSFNPEKMRTYYATQKQNIPAQVKKNFTGIAP